MAPILKSRFESLGIGTRYLMFAILMVKVLLQLAGITRSPHHSGALTMDGREILWYHIGRLPLGDSFWGQTSAEMFFEGLLD